MTKVLGGETLKIASRTALLFCCVCLLTQSGLAQAVRPAHQDLDGDGRSDLLLSNRNNGNVTAHFLNGTAIAREAVVFPGLELDWHFVGSGDFDGDRKADLLWHNFQKGEVVVWLMDGSSVKSFSKIASGIDFDWYLAGVGDFDGDGKSDLIWQNYNTGEVVEWRMDGLTLKSWASLLKGGNQFWEWLVVGAGDMDGDGKSDLLWGNYSSDDVVVWLMDGFTVRSWSTVSTHVGANSNWYVSGLGDLDGDGKSDVIWRNFFTGDVVAWLMNGATIKSFATVASSVPLAWDIRNVFDIDGDGNCDLVWQNSQAGSTVGWLMSGTTIRSFGFIIP